MIKDLSYNPEEWNKSEREVVGKYNGLLLDTLFKQKDSNIESFLFHSEDIMNISIPYLQRYSAECLGDNYEMDIQDLMWKI